MNQRVKRYLKNCKPSIQLTKILRNMLLEFVVKSSTILRVKSIYKTKHFQNLFIVIRSKLDAIKVPFKTFFVAGPQMVEKLHNTCFNRPK